MNERSLGSVSGQFSETCGTTSHGSGLEEGCQPMLGV